MSEQGKLYALLIGVNDYASAALRNLRYAVADVLEFRDLLVERMGLTKERCLLLTYPQIAGANQPSRTSVLRAFDRLADLKLTELDTLVCYFAGHGFSVEGEMFLMASDSELGTRSLLQDTAVSLGKLKSYLRNVDCGQQLLILDACRNEPRETGRRGAQTTEGFGAMTREIATVFKPERDETLRAGHRRALAVLHACAEHQFSHESEQERHGWFSTHLLRALRTAPAGPWKLTQEWVKALGERMQEAAELHLPEAAGQRPYPVFAGEVLELMLRPCSTESLPLLLAPEPVPVQVKEVEIKPIRIEPATVAGAQVQVSGLPPIPGEVLELEGRVKGIEEAIQQIESGTHWSLETARETVQQVEHQYEELEAELRIHAPQFETVAARESLETKALQEPAASLSSLCDLAPELDPTAVLGHVQRLRHADQARQSLEKTRRQYEVAESQELNRLRRELQESKQSLERLKSEDLNTVLDCFFPSVGDAERFPLAAWNQFLPSLLKRRYPWPVREIVRRAEFRWVERWDERAWRDACRQGTKPAFERYLATGSGGSENEAQVRQHAEEARLRLREHAARRLRTVVVVSALTVLGFVGVMWKVRDQSVLRSAESELAKGNAGGALETLNIRLPMLPWHVSRLRELQERAGKELLSQEEKAARQALDSGDPASAAEICGRHPQTAVFVGLLTEAGEKARELAQTAAGRGRVADIESLQRAFEGDPMLAEYRSEAGEVLNAWRSSRQAYERRLAEQPLNLLELHESDPWRKAQQLAAEARTNLTDLATASQAYAEALVNLEQAIADATTLVSARTAYEQAVSAQAPALLDRLGGPAWQSARQLAGEAAASTNNLVEGTGAYAEALGYLQEAITNVTALMPTHLPGNWLRGRTDDRFGVVAEEGRIRVRYSSIDVALAGSLPGNVASSIWSNGLLQWRVLREVDTTPTSMLGRISSLVKTPQRSLLTVDYRGRLVDVARMTVEVSTNALSWAQAGVFTNNSPGGFLSLEEMASAFRQKQEAYESKLSALDTGLLDQAGGRFFDEAKRWSARGRLATDLAEGIDAYDEAVKNLDAAEEEINRQEESQERRQREEAQERERAVVEREREQREAEQRKQFMTQLPGVLPGTWVTSDDATFEVRTESSGPAVASYHETRHRPIPEDENLPFQLLDSQWSNGTFRWRVHHPAYRYKGGDAVFQVLGGTVTQSAKTRWYRTADYDGETLTVEVSEDGVAWDLRPLEFKKRAW